MIRRLFIIAAVLLAACASKPVDPLAEREKDPKFRYGRNPGPSPVGAIPDVVLNDAQRNKDIKLTIEYPTRGGPHPLIVFSHEKGGSNRSYSGLSSHWTGYGYVVVRVAHTSDDVQDRARDVVFILDSLAKLAEAYPELQGKIDATKIGVAGHGIGAVSAASINDPRVKAVVAMSPEGGSGGPWAGLKLPAVVMVGTVAMSETDTPAWRQQAYDLAAEGDKWLVLVEGAGHGTFTGQAAPLPQTPRAPPPMVTNRPTGDEIEREMRRQQSARAMRGEGVSPRELFARIRAVALAFFDNYLKGEAAGREYLEQADAKSSFDVKHK